MFPETRPLVLLAALFLTTSAFAQATALNVFKQGAPNPIVAGNEITYTITVSTEGPDDAADVNLTDVLPAGTTFVSLDSEAGWSCTTPAVGAGGTVTCTIATFAPGSAFFTLILDTDPSLANGSTLSNTATVTTTTNDRDQDDNTSTANTPVVTEADLSITKSFEPDPAPIGGTVTFTLGYASAGPSIASNVVIEDDLPAGLLFQSIVSPGWSCTTPAVGANGTVSCSQASMALGASGTITITATVDSSVSAGTTFTNTATIGSDTTDPDPSDDSATDTATAQSVSDLAVTKSASADPVVAGGTITYTIGVTASGPSPAPNVTLTDALPAQTTFVSIVSPAGWSCTTPAVGANGTVTCTNAQLAAGASDTFTLVVNVDANVASGTSIANTATVSGDVVEDTTNNSATATVTTGVAFDVGVTKSAPATIFAGNAMTYSIAYTVTGPSTAAAVTITDALPAQTTFASITAPAGFVCTTPAVGANGTVSCTAATLTGSGMISIGVTVDPATPPATSIVNTATVTSVGDTDGNNDSSTATTVVGGPTVTGTKSVEAQAPLPGETITYTVVLQNHAAFAQGNNPGDEFVDVLPPSLTLVSTSANSGTALANVATNTVTWNGAIPSGGSVTITIVARINAGTEGTTISNQGTIHYDGDNNGTNESTTVTDAPGGGATTFVVGAAIAPVPALSPAMLALVAMMLGIAGWVVAGRR